MEYQPETYYEYNGQEYLIQEADGYRFCLDPSVPDGICEIDADELYGVPFIRYGIGKSESPKIDSTKKYKKHNIIPKNLFDLCRIALIVSVIIPGIVYVVTSGIISNIAGVIMLWNAFGGIVSAYVIHDYEIK